MLGGAGKPVAFTSRTEVCRLTFTGRLWEMWLLGPTGGGNSGAQSDPVGTAGEKTALLVVCYILCCRREMELYERASFLNHSVSFLWQKVWCGPGKGHFLTSCSHWPGWGSLPYLALWVWVTTSLQGAYIVEPVTLLTRFNPVNGGSTFLQNISICLQD
jgi:hypothetical protein